MVVSAAGDYLQLSQAALSKSPRRAGVWWLALGFVERRVKPVVAKFLVASIITVVVSITTWSLSALVPAGASAAFALTSDFRPRFH